MHYRSSAGQEMNAGSLLDPHQDCHFDRCPPGIVGRIMSWEKTTHSAIVWATLLLRHRPSHRHGHPLL